MHETELEKKKGKKNSIDVKLIHELLDAFYSLGEKGGKQGYVVLKVVPLCKQI